MSTRPRQVFFRPSLPAAAYNQSFQTFNSLNAYILKGDGAQGHGHDVRHIDGALPATSPTRCTALPRSRVAISPDGAGLSLHDPAPKRNSTMARNSPPVTPAFSLNILKTKGHPIITQQVRDMLKAEAADDATLVVTFCRKAWPADVPLFVAGLPIFFASLLREHVHSKNRRSIFRLAAGPYKVSKFEVNRFIEFERVRDWWGRRPSGQPRQL